MFTTRIAANSTDQEVLPKEEFSKFVRIVNEGAEDVFIKFETTATTTDYSEKLVTGRETPFVLRNWSGEPTSIHAITATNPAIITIISY